MSEFKSNSSYMKLKGLIKNKDLGIILYVLMQRMLLVSLTKMYVSFL